MLKQLSFFIAFNFALFAVAEMDYLPVPGPNGQVMMFSRLIMGTDHLAQANWSGENQPQPTEEMIFRVLDEAVKNGMNVIDTSPIYVGNIENLVGKWLKLRREAIKSDNFYADPSLNPDRKIYVISKAGFPFDLYYSKELPAGTHSEELLKALREKGILSATSTNNQSARLNNVPPYSYASRLYGDLDQIVARLLEEVGHTVSNLGQPPDVLLMHRDDGDIVDGKEIARHKTSVETIMKALSSSPLADKFKILGWSNWEVGRIAESLVLSDTNPNYKRPIFNSPYFSLLEERGKQTIHSLGTEVEHPELVGHRILREKSGYLDGIFLSPYSPLGGFSILDRPWEAAKADAERKFRDGDAYWRHVYQTIFTPENEMRYQRALAFTKKLNSQYRANYTIDQVMNAYALAHKRLDFVTVGPISVEQVQRTVAALPLSKIFTPNDLEHLYHIENSERLGSGSNPVKQQCLNVYK
jgi:aryl-alcohol dehydrogenase-like predicted oxidoreductase